MSIVRIMLVDSNAAFVKGTRDTLQREDDLEVVATAYDGAEALKTALTARPDVMVTGLVMPVLDGFALMEALFRAKLGIRVVVLSELTRDCFIRQAMSLGACYYMIKPVDPAVLVSRVRDSVHFEDVGTLASPVGNLEDPVSPLLASVGITPGTAGHRYLHLAVTMAARMESLSGRITTEIYPAVARAFQTDQRNVERAIRHAIRTACTLGSAPDATRLTNGEVIARLARQYAAKLMP